MEDLKVPRVREGNFHPQILPYRKRIFLELSEAILALSAVGGSTRKISAFLKRDLRRLLLAPEYLLSLEGTQEQVELSRERSLSKEYCVVFLDGTFFLHPSRENGQGAGLHSLRDQTRWAKGDPWVLVFGAEGESARSEEEVLKDLKRRGVQRVRIFEPLTSQA